MFQRVYCCNRNEAREGEVIDPMIAPLAQDEYAKRWDRNKCAAVDLHKTDKVKYLKLGGRVNLKNAAIGSEMLEEIDLLNESEYEAMGYSGAMSLMKQRRKERLERMPKLYSHNDRGGEVFWNNVQGVDSELFCYPDIRRIEKPKPEQVTQAEIGELFTMLAGTLTAFAKRIQENGIKS
jgi:hypothetical protein